MEGQTCSVANWHVAANGQFTTNPSQHNATITTPPWPSVSEYIPRVRLGITVFCVLPLPRVPLGVTAKEVNARVRMYTCRYRPILKTQSGYSYTFFYSFISIKNVENKTNIAAMSPVYSPCPSGSNCLWAVTYSAFSSAGQLLWVAVTVALSAVLSLAICDTRVLPANP